MTDSKISYSWILEKSWDRMMAILFWDFSWKKWLSLILIGFLAGQLSLGSGIRKSLQKRNPNALSSQEKASFSNAMPAPGSSSAPPSIQPQVSEGEKDLQVQDAKLRFQKKPVSWIHVMTIMLIAAPFLLFFCWLGARFRLIWIHDLVHNQTQIKQPWKENAALAQSYFLGSLVLGAYALAILGVSFAGGTAVVHWLSKMAGMVLLRILASFFLLVLFILEIVALIFFSVLFFDLGIPKMYFDRELFSPTMKSLWQWWKANKGLYWKFFWVNLGISILTMVIVSIVALIVTGVGFFIFLFPLSALSHSPWAIFKILGGALFIIEVILWIIVLMAVRLPGAVFLNHLELHFLARIDPKYALPALDESSNKSV